jgi:hypothetical protein
MNAKPAIPAILLAALFAPIAAAQSNIPAHAFKSGETFFYLVHLKSNRDIKTKSALVLPQLPIAATINVTGILQVEVISAESPASGTRLRTWFLNLASDVEALPPGSKPDPALSQSQKTPGEGKFVDCILQPDGQIAQIEGLDQFASEQQNAWREWAGRFATAFLLESQSRKRGEKWSSEEPENSPSPIAELHWQQKSQYAKDENCAPQKFTRGLFERSAAQELCAVILSTAALLQESSAQDSTPPDYKRKSLKTRGTAKGNNDTILYISRKTGKLIRATQSAKQQMDVIIALADGSRSVRYAIKADASSTVELVTDLPLMLQPKSGN